MNVSGGNSKEVFELFTNKLVFSVSVSQRWRIRWRSWLSISSLDSPLERSASSRIIMKEFLFLFSIWFISLSSNLKLSIDIFIMSVGHVFADFRFIFVKCSCSRRDGTSLFSLFYKIILYIQGSRLRRNHFLRVCKYKFEVVALVRVHGLRTASRSTLYQEKDFTDHVRGFSRAWFHTARVSRAEAAQRGAYAEREQRARSGQSTKEDLVFKLK